ncbi:hypothetical protein V6N13_042934 [Hibiscus sabdariffa]
MKGDQDGCLEKWERVAASLGVSLSLLTLILIFLRFIVLRGHDTSVADCWWVSDITQGVQSCVRQFCKVQSEEFGCEVRLGVLSWCLTFICIGGGGRGLCFVMSFCCSRVSFACRAGSVLVCSSK